MPEPYEAAGAAQAKTGPNMNALDRSSGLSRTLEAMGSKVRSGHPATATNNKWKDPELGWGDGNNVKGYTDSGGGD